VRDLINDQGQPSAEPRPVVAFDHTSPEYAANMDAINRDLRERCPVAFTESLGGYWVVAAYEPLTAAMRDDATFSSLHAPEPVDGIRFAGVNIPEAPYCNRLLEEDPPEWAGPRRLLAPFFSPGAVEALRPQLTEWTTVAIDRVIESGEVDFVLDIANPVPAQATLLLLGLPVEDWERYAAPAHEVVFTRPGTPEFERAVAGQAWMFEELFRQIAARRAEPTGDMLGLMVATEVDGRLLGDEELVSLCGTMINGGVDTTTALLANAVDLLDRDRDLRARLIADSGLLPAATEEFLRFFSPVQSFSRTVTRDTELAGRPLERGDRVLMCFGSANRDEAEFSDPDEFVADRFPNRHVAFGVGKHRCIGSTLAREVFMTMLSQILERMPDYELDRDGSERYESCGIVNGWVRLPGRFTPAPRRGVSTTRGA
jgi:cytochrome P450